MNKFLDFLAATAIAIGVALVVACSLLLAVGCAVIGAVLRTLPWILVILVIAWLVTGCVYQPIQVDVYVPTTAVVGGDVALDASKIQLLK